MALCIDPEKSVFIAAAIADLLADIMAPEDLEIFAAFLSTISIDIGLIIRIRGQNADSPPLIPDED